MEEKIRLGLKPFEENIEIINKKSFYEEGINTPIELYENYKISILLSDGMDVVMNDRIYNTSIGDIVVFGPSELHFARIMRGGEHHYMTFLIPASLLSALDGEDLAYIFEDTEKNRVNHISPAPEEKMEIIKVCEKIQALISDKKNTDICVFAYVIELLHISRSLYERAKINPKVSSSSPVITGAMRYITKNYKTVKDLCEIAESVNCSVTYLTRTFKRHTGKTVWNYLTECRIAHAKIMLEEGRGVTETCYECGFGDCSGFIKLFKKYEGITPLKYKNQKS